MKRRASSSLLTSRPHRSTEFQIRDYEGISGHESYRGDLGLMYYIDIDLADRY